MSNVGQLRPRHRFDVVVIDCARIIETSHESCRGKSRIVHQPPKVSYFVTVCEADGGRIILWDGPTYAAARAEALKIAADWGGCQIIDHASSVAT